MGAALFEATLSNSGLNLRRGCAEILQLNVGKLCNLTCSHCHVNAGPARKEIISRDTLDRVLDWMEATDIPTLDLTGGAPEMIPDFRYVIERVRSMRPRRRLIDRCNLTILLQAGYEDIVGLLAANEVDVVASMPCYSAENVNAQRGEGVFDASIEALRRLNAAGYGNGLTLDLVYNPVGAKLPGDQAELEEDYKRELREHFGIEFNRLYTITNMPIARFASFLKRTDQLAGYMQVLVEAFNPAAVDGLMCRNTISVGWQGEIYDCDFNQQLGIKWGGGRPARIWELDLESIEGRAIATGSHCFGCTAGAGSSCGGTIAS